MAIVKKAHRFNVGVPIILDFALSKQYPMPMHAIALDISPAIAYSGDCVISTLATNKRDDSEPLRLLVLDNYVLAFIVTSILLVSVVAFLFSVILKKQKPNLVSLFKHIWIFVADFLQNQDLSILGQQLHTLLLVGAWILGSLVICKGYAGCISCNMIVPSYSPINTIEDILERKNMIPFVTPDGKVMSYLKASHPTNYEKLKSRAEKMNSYFETIDEFSKENMSNFYEGKAVIIYSRRYQNAVLLKFSVKTSRKGRRKIYIGDSTYDTKPLYYFLRKGLDRGVRENIVYLILRYMETSQDSSYETSRNDFLALTLFEKTSAVYPTKALTMQFLWTGFKIYFICVAISILSLIMEGICYNI